MKVALEGIYVVEGEQCKSFRGEDHFVLRE